VMIRVPSSTVFKSITGTYTTSTSGGNTTYIFTTSGSMTL
jgi:hypothetical protein